MRSKLTFSPVKLMLILSVISMVGLQTGCQNATPIEKAYALGTMYAEAQAEVISARQAGLLTDTQFDAIADANKVAAPLVKEALRSAAQAETETVPWKKTFDFNKAYDAARAAVRQVLMRLAAAQGK